MQIEKKEVKEIFQEKEKLKEKEFKKIKIEPKFEDLEEVEIGKLTEEDFDEVFRLLTRVGWEVDKKDLLKILKYRMSFGAFVERMLIAVALAWPVHFDENSLVLKEGNENSLYLEEVAILLKYEGSGIRKRLILARENEAKKNFAFTLSILEKISTQSSTLSIREERFCSAEIFKELNYTLIPLNDKIIAFKRL